MSGTLRWGAPSLMLADCLAKDMVEPADFRCIRSGLYQMSDGSSVLAQASAECSLRKQLATRSRPYPDGQGRGEEQREG
eukprot:442674-Pyramimonas_sp.AAC.1